MQNENIVSASLEQTAKKPFIEPAISTPIDVLAATAFFQAVGSGTAGDNGTGDSDL